jgi:hypothetical protein
MVQTNSSADKAKSPYQKPELKTWGTIADLTQLGFTNPGGDTKGGSVLHCAVCL